MEVEVKKLIDDLKADFKKFGDMSNGEYILEVFEKAYQDKLKRIDELVLTFTNEGSLRTMGYYGEQSNATLEEVKSFVTGLEKAKQILEG